MWGAIKSDLFSFVTTIQDDTTKTLNRVLGDNEEEEEDEVTLQEKLVADLRRSFETYETPIRAHDSKDYEKFKKTFNLSSSAAEIARVLDEESEVSRFYAELVPISLAPEEFWGRLFFRINQIYRNGSANLDLEDDEEELVWDEEVEVKEEVEEPTAHVDQEVKEDVGTEDGSNTKSGSSQTLRVPSADHGTSTHVDTASRGAQTASSSAATTLDPATDAREVAQIISLNEHMKERVQVLESDNQRLVSHEEELLRRIEELEARLAAQEIAQAAAAMLAVPSSISEEESTVRAAEVTVTPPSKRRPASKAAAPSTTPATQGYFDATTPPVAAAPSTKKKGSTAKKLFDSPAAVPLKEEESVAAAPAPVVVAEAAVVPAPAVHVSDHVSQSSDESAVVVNLSDNALEDDLPAPAPRTTSSSTSGTAGVTDAKGTKGAFSSQETAKYLAALDDQDEEEDGWN